MKIHIKKKQKKKCEDTKFSIQVNWGAVLQNFWIKVLTITELKYHLVWEVLLFGEFITYPLRITITRWDWKNSVLYLGRCLERKQNLYLNTWVTNSQETSLN